jgi:hypothetical protein
MRGFVFAALLAVACTSEVRAQDAAAGEKVFGVCKTCHQIGEGAKNGIAPVLNGIIGRNTQKVSVNGARFTQNNFQINGIDANGIGGTGARLADPALYDAAPLKARVLKGVDSRLDQSAAEALRKWEFEPAERNGAPVEVDLVAEIPFVLAPQVRR